MSERDEPELYDVDEVEAILVRALTRSEKREGLSPDELREAAREVGIDDRALDAAIVEVREDRIVDAERARITQRRRYGFGTHVFVFLMVSLGVHLLAPRLAIVMMLGWGLGVFFHGLRALPPAKIDRARLLRRSEKRRLRKERDRRAAELQRAATDGMTEVFRSATSALEERRSRRGRARSRERDEVPSTGFGPPRATPRAPRVEAEDAEVVETPEPHDRGRKRR